ncbi:MAG: PDZ domain-containing protein [Erysipelotrichaceae bacterium]|nr:PDZ domain-containing protein [Erysipelotrichaceae bacterium]
MWKRTAALLLCAGLFMPLTVYANSEVYIGGDSVGIAVHYEGIMVSGTYTVEQNGSSYNPSKQGFVKGDVIIAVNGIKVKTMEDLYQELLKYQKPVNEIAVTVKHGQKTIDRTLTTVFDDKTQSFKSGLYVKDEITGVGTVTFYNPVNGQYGALGHEIMDNDLNQIATIADGNIYSSEVNSITKAQPNVAGEKNATINYNDPLGSVSKNTDIGIYGAYKDLPQHAKKYEWASREAVHTGKATIETVLNDQQIKSYEIEITKVNKQDSKDVKGIEFTVTDENLLAAANGIVQGMSGSPIIQDGKLIGAVTHVVTSNPVNGYGVYAEWMIQQTES